jgi:hypothetical protein
LSRFVATALNAADAAIALAATPHLTRLLRALRARDVDIDSAMDKAATFRSMPTSRRTRAISRGDQRRACGRHQPGGPPRRLLRGTGGTLVGRGQNGGGGRARTILRCSPGHRHSVRVSGAMRGSQIKSSRESTPGTPCFASCYLRNVGFV